MGSINMGELQKRIAKLLEDNFFSLWDDGMGDGYTSPKEIEAIIEEMKKEFPKRYAVYGSSAYADERLEFCDEVEEWLKKWLE